MMEMSINLSSVTIKASVFIITNKITFAKVP